MLTVPTNSIASSAPNSRASARRGEEKHVAQRAHDMMSRPPLSPVLPEPWLVRKNHVPDVSRFVQSTRKFCTSRTAPSVSIVPGNDAVLPMMELVRHARRGLSGPCSLSTTSVSGGGAREEYAYKVLLLRRLFLLRDGKRSSRSSRSNSTAGKTRLLGSGDLGWRVLSGEKKKEDGEDGEKKGRAPQAQGPDNHMQWYSFGQDEEHWGEEGSKRTSLIPWR
ncbi:hypothetical protein BKA80DRAFT_639 [Phyllosticta citrichinensis]